MNNVVDLRRFKEADSGPYKELSKQCPSCYAHYKVWVNIDAFTEWKRGRFIQEAFDFLSSDEREMIQTGICSPECWDKMTGTDPTAEDIAHENEEYLKKIDEQCAGFKTGQPTDGRDLDRTEQAVVEFNQTEAEEEAINTLRRIANMPCTGSYKPIGKDYRVACKRCASCRARDYFGETAIPPNARLICKACGYTQ